MISKENPNSRGRVELIKLKKHIILNSKKIERALIEIDHINYGLDKKTLKLNKKPRTSFTIRDIEKFIMLLNDENLMPDKYKKRKQQFSIRLDCPIKGKFLGKEFIMIFDTDFDQEDLIHTVTLFPGW